MEYIKEHQLEFTIEPTRIYSGENEFRIEGKYLFINVEEQHRGHGLARWMMYQLLSTLQYSMDDWFMIDGDASGGFWDHVGFKEGRYGYMVYRRPPHSTRRKDTEGGEKSITFRDLWKWVKGTTYQRYE